MKELKKLDHPKHLYLIISFAVLLFSFLPNLFSQSLNVDRLTNIVASNQHDTIRIKAIEKLMRFYYTVDSEQSERFSLEMGEISRKNNLLKEEVTALLYLGSIYNTRNISIDSVIVVLQEALDKANYIANKELQASILFGMGEAYFKVGSYNKALEIQHQVLKISKKNDLTRKELQALMAIAYIHTIQKSNDKALRYNKIGLKKAYEIDDKEMIAALLNSLGSIYVEYEKPDSALLYFTQALDLVRTTNNKYAIVAISNNIGAIYSNKEKLDIAENYITIAYNTAKEAKYIAGEAESLGMLSIIANKRGDHIKGISLMKQALALNIDFHFKKELYGSLTTAYIKAGKNDLSLATFKKYQIVVDSFYNIESKKQIDELTIKYDVLQKEIENKLLKENQEIAEQTIRNRTLAALGLILALMFAIGWGSLIYRANQRKKRLNQILETKVQERTAELQSANKNLEQANRELRTFNYIASHDIKEPIRIIGGYAGLIFKKLPPDLKESLGEDFNTIKRSTSHLYTLIEDFANYTTMSKNETIETEEVNLNQLTIGIVEQLEESIQKYNGQVLTAELPTIQSSNSLLFTTLKNLIENGLKYNKSDKPTVEIDYHKTETHHEIIISDNGIGINKQYHAQVFKMFKRLHNRGAYEGSGIGLAIVKLSADKLGGKVLLESEEGKGSRFVIQLPL
jgi:signal transduction histidine kinase